MEDIKRIVAANIAELRLMNGMTQLELAEKLNYSDKTISKWERAESSPDISVLIEIANLFGVTLDYLVKAEHPMGLPFPEDLSSESDSTVADTLTDKTASVSREGMIYNRRAIAYISESAAWLVAILAFIITTLISSKLTFQFLYFVYTLPIVLIIKLVFNSVWFNPRRNYFIVSLLMWSIFAAIHITFLYFSINVALIYLLAVAGEAVIVLWSFIAKPRKSK